MNHRQKTSLILALLCFAVAAFVAVMAGAQNVAEMPLIRETPKQTVPITCPKYQHVFHWPGGCGPSPCDGTACYAVCMPPPPDSCVDDMHIVTEREWQELQERIARLEQSTVIISNQSTDVGGLPIGTNTSKSSTPVVSTKPGCCNNCTLPNVPRCKATKADRRAR